jgi:hypothetical protein
MASRREACEWGESVSEAKPAPDDQPVGQVQIAADDQLLTALGSGEPPPQPDDQVAAILAAWRADLDSDLDAPAQAPLDPPETDPAVRPRVRSLRRPARASAAARPTPRPRRTPRQRLNRTLIGAAAAAIVLIGLGVAAHESGPGSPLWPLTQVAYPQHAEVVAAERAIDDARSAVDAGRYDDARRLLAIASSHVARVDNQATARRLRTEIADIQRELDTIAPPTPAPAAPAPPNGPGNPASPAPTPPPAGTAPRGGQPQPGQTAGKAPATTGPPILQTPPLPSLPVPPPPSLPLPTSILPSLPLRL